MNLLIVESPNKIKKIAKILGSDWKVMASVGHIRDLPTKEMGVSPPNFKPTYVTNPKSKKTIGYLKAAAAKANDVYLATDPDREGEAISWHLEKSLHLKNPIRVTFQEITKKAVLKALETQGIINYPLVRAQEARRVLDRLVGYMVSPALSKLKQQHLSAGRVQSVALRLVVEREREIENFKPTHYFVVRVLFETDGIKWFADWNTRDMLPKGQKYLTDKTLANSLSGLRDFTVAGIDKKETKSAAPAPFTTSTLQQAASVSLRYNPKQTMQLAQKLFEEGLISYHRTDSCNLSGDAIEAIHAWLNSHCLGAEVPDTPNTWGSKANSQEAHEAIRPTDIEHREISLGDPKAEKLYSLIWERTVASQMRPAIFDVTIVHLRSVDEVANKKQPFISKGRVLRSPGWLKLTEDKTQESDSESKDDEQKLPDIKETATLTAFDGSVLAKETKPPPRYTEASLVKKLDKEGIGRPSTYASILDNIKHREYIEIIKRKLHATDLGKSVNDALVGCFNFMEYAFTKDMETTLDKVASGKEMYLPTVSQFHAQLTQDIKKMLGANKAFTTEENLTQHACPACEKPMRRLNSKNGVFWGCTGFPECKTTLPDNDGVPGQKIVVETKGACPECGEPMVKRTSKKGKTKTFWGCSAYPKCKTSVPDNNGSPGVRKVVEQGGDCGDCGKPMVKRKGKKGYFWGCSGFPKCKTTQPIT